MHRASHLHSSAPGRFCLIKKRTLTFYIVWSKDIWGDAVVLSSRMNDCERGHYSRFMGEREMERRVFMPNDEQEELWRNYTSPNRPLTSAALETLFVVTGGALGGPARNAKKRKVMVPPKPIESVESVGVVGAEDLLLKVVIQGLSGRASPAGWGEGVSAKGKLDQGKPAVEEVRTAAIQETDKVVEDAEKWTACSFSVITPRSSLGPGICLPLWCWRVQP